MTENALVPELSVQDWQRSRSFYLSIIGFEVLYERPEEGFSYLALGEAQLMIDQIGVGRTFTVGDAAFSYPLGRGVNLQLRVPDLGAILKRVEASGITPVIAPEERWYRRDGMEIGNRQFVLADPDGYLIRPFESLGTRPFMA